MTSSPRKRVIAVDPGMQYLAIAVLDGDDLVRYAVKTFPGSKGFPERRVQVRQYLTELLRIYRPTVLAVEEPFYAPSLLSNNLTKLTDDIKTWGRWKGLQVHSYIPPAVKAFFCRDDKTKQSLAEAMVAKYPFLARYFTLLPWRRRYWFHVFDAVALGLMCQRKLAR